MKKRKPFRIKLLLSVCWISCAITFLIVGATILLIAEHPDSLLGPILLALLIGLFFLHSASLIAIIRKYYPDSEIRSERMKLHRILSTMVIIELVIFFVGFLGLLIMDAERIGAGKEFEKGSDIIALVIFLILVICQIYMLFEGHRVIENIQRNYRAQLMSSF